MQYNNMINKSLKGLVLGAALFFAAPPAWAQDIPLVFVEGDESSTEVQLLQFLKSRTNWPVVLDYFGNDRRDAYLRIPFTLEGGASVNIYVDTLFSSTQENERRVNVYGYFILNNTLGTRKRGALLEVLNQHTIDEWMSQRLYIDNDGDIAFSWVINIPGTTTPIHAEQVYDAIIRTKFSLDGLLPKLKPLGLP